MAESKRKTPVVTVEEKDEAQAKKDRMTLIVMLVGGVIIVLGMIALSKFLSGS